VNSARGDTLVRNGPVEAEALGGAGVNEGGEMSDTADIVVRHDGPLATVVFNRPKVRNAISLGMWAEIARVTDGIAKDDSIRAIVYRGAGMEAFASGADISEFEEQRKDTESTLRYNAQTSAAYAAIRGCPQPTVAMIHGFCMGGGMGIAMACDLRFAAQGAKFGIPAARLSILYGADAVRQLIDLAGPAYAKDILYSARTVSDREALAMGLIQRLLPAAELESYTYDYLRQVADNAPLSVQGAKMTVEAHLAGMTEVHRQRLRELQLEAFESEDYREGTRAFLEKRPPRFQGR
jgi:enoyl-CoA hydratase/carnithine racemase